MINSKKSILSILVLLIISITSVNVLAVNYTDSTSKNSGYNRNAARDYALSWAGCSNSSKYANYMYDNGDCTNFVSQVLYAGGMGFSGSTSAPDNKNAWYYYGSSYPNRTPSWTGAHQFRNHWGNTSSSDSSYGYNRDYSYKEYDVATALRYWDTIYSLLWPGDVVQYADSTGATCHSQVIHDYTSTNKTIYFAQHSTTWSGFYSSGDLRDYLLSKPSNYRFYVHSIKNGS